MNSSLQSYVNDTTKLGINKRDRTDRLKALSDSVKKLEPGFLDQIMMLERLSGEGKKMSKTEEKKRLRKKK